MGDYNDFWVEPNGECSRSSDTYVGVSVDGAVLLMDSGDHETYETVENCLRQIDSSEVDPVRNAARLFVAIIHANDDTKRWQKDTCESFEKLESLL